MTHHIKIPKGWEMPEEELTPESIFRRPDVRMLAGVQ